MKNKDFSRRDFLLKASALGAVAIGGSSVLAACGGKEGGSETPAAAPAAPQAAPKTAAAGCNDLTGLTDQEKQMRTALQYVDATPIAEKRCDNCQLYVVPEGDSPCGGCKILKGPVAPAGYCTSWAAKQA